MMLALQYSWCFLYLQASKYFYFMYVCMKQPILSLSL